MHTAEVVGFETHYILSQRGISYIKNTVEIAKTNKGVDIDIHNFPMLMQDPGIKEKTRIANTISTFYVESP